jgi:YD repeat-containing protein
MTKQTSPQGIVTTYEYDAFGRLQTVKDHNGNQLEGYDYHYKNP